MSQQFSNQGGAANSDPNVVVRWLTSTLMTRLFTPEKMEARRAKAEAQRKKSGEPHRVRYFHQVDDGYSHLAAQILPALAARYDIELECYLVRGPEGHNLPEPELLLSLSRYDAYHVAPEYGLEFPRHEQPLPDALRKKASAILAAQTSADFVQRAAIVGRALWAGNADKLEQTNATLNRDLNGKVDETQNLKRDLEDAMTKNQEYQHKNEQLAEKIAALTAQKADVDKELAVLSQALKATKTEVKTIQDKVTYLTDENKVILQEKAMILGQFKQLQGSL